MSGILQHSDWAPSAMARILTCAGSVELSKLYPKEDSDASLQGTEAHGVLEDCLTFGIDPKHEDIDIVEGVELALDWLEERIDDDTKLFAEKRLAIPDTPIWGTTDIVLVNRSSIHIADFKFGWLPVEVAMNAQLLAYLVGAIAEFGERKHYYITVIQPRYNHVDGPIRTYTVSNDDIAWFMGKVKWALAHSDEFKPSSNCRWCPARGDCKFLAGWIVPKINTAFEYDITQRHTFSPETLGKLLDFADLANGWAKELRSAAHRRAMQDRELGGWKMVVGRQDRSVDQEAAEGLYERLGIPVEALWETKREMVSPAQIEKAIRAHFGGRTKAARKERDEALAKFEDILVKTRGAPSLVRASDGRPLYQKGMEFTELPSVETEDGGIV